MSARKFKPNDTVDFVVVGSGAAGGVMARELSQAGFEVLVLEQGPRFTAADFRHDELDYWFNGAITNKLDTNPQTFRKTAAEKAERVTEFPAAWYAPNVGGSSVHFTANFWRLHEVDFNERSRLGAIAGTTFSDWPITYDELEPYYTKVEWEVGVSGLAGASPFDPWRSKPYPMPPLPVKSSGVLLERGARKMGWHPYPAPMAIASVPYKDRAACAHCGFCIGFGCEMQAKSSTLYTMIPEAEATGRCEVRPLSYVSRIETNAAGRATGVAYFDKDKREHFQKARAVVVCANGAETSRLLLMSANAKFPDGLANSSGYVGKNLMFNTYAEVNALFEHELNEFKSAQVTRVVHDWYDSDPQARFLRRRRHRFAHRPDADCLVAVRATAGPHLGRRVQIAARGTAARDDRRRSRHVVAARDQPHRPRSGTEGRLGPARAAHDVQGPSGRPGDGALPAGSWRRVHAGRRRARSLEGPGHRIDRRAAPAGHRAHGQRPEDVGRRQVPPVARHPRTCSSATARAW